MWCSGLGEVTLAETRLNKKASSLWPRRGQATKTTCANTFRQGCLRQAQGTTHWTTCGSQPLLCYRRFWMGGGKAPGKASVPPPRGPKKQRAKHVHQGPALRAACLDGGGEAPGKKCPRPRVGQRKEELQLHARQRPNGVRCARMWGRFSCIFHTTIQHTRVHTYE